MNGYTCAVINHWYSDDWCTDERATSQEELQKIAAKISKTCKITHVGQTKMGACTIYENEALSIRYWIKDEFGVISEIDEARYC